MVALHQRGYKPDGLDEKECLLVAKPLDGSDWTDEEKALFREAIFEYRKDLKAVAKKMNKSMGNVITYYLGSYKHSDDYRLLKLVCQQETLTLVTVIIWLTISNTVMFVTKNFF